jgi:ferredoxin
MADKSNKLATNVAGKYYVTGECIGCAQCADIAPKHFKLGGDGLAFVYSQPKNAEEIDSAEQALAACPVEAIGNDGE